MSSSDWPLDDDLVALRDLVRKFVATEVRPLEEGLDPDALELPPEDLSVVQAKAQQAGLWCIGSPGEYGGANLTLLQQAVVAEEAARCRMGLESTAAGAFGYDPPSVIFGGTTEQISEFAVPAISAGQKTFVALSEPEGGSDPARSIRTTAERDGDDWVINGSKMWISGADTADWGILFARTDRSAGRGGISCFIADTNRPGFAAHPIPVIRSWFPCEVVLMDYRIPADRLLGVEGEGFKLAKRWLDPNRIRYAAAVLGVAAEAIEMAVDYAKQRVVFGGRLADKQGLAFPLVDSEIELRAARMLVYAAAARADSGQSFSTEASMAKIFATETAGRIVDRCIQVFGAMGVSKALPLERWYRELRVKRIGEGPSEVHRMAIARKMFGSVSS